MENKKGLRLPERKSMLWLCLLFPLIMMLIITPLLSAFFSGLFMLGQLWLAFTILFVLSLFLLIYVWRIPFSDNFFKNIRIYFYVAVGFACFFYAFFYFFYSGSPYLRLKYFQLSHPGWHQAKQVQLKEVLVDYEFVTKGPNFAYLDINYNYVDDKGKSQHGLQKKAYRVYQTFAHWEDSDKNEAELKTELPGLLAEQTPIILYNSKAQNESRLFFGKKWLDFRQTSYFSYDLSLFALLTVMFLILGLIAFKIRV